jgi:uncharacterized protein (DUF2141 family)
MRRRDSSLPFSPDPGPKLVLLAAAALLAGCARQGLPEGGPRDLTPPRVVRTEPDSAAIDVPVGADVAITFSEPMDRASVLDWILISPPRDFGERSWSGNTFKLTGGEDCRGERERVILEAPHLFVFSTGDSIDAGRIDGRLIAHNVPPHGVMMWALDMERAAARTDTLLPDYVTQVGADSTFTFLGLKPGRRYLVMAHGDMNRDREFDRELDFLSIDPTPIWLDPASPVAHGVRIDFRNSRSPGGIAGTVVDTTAAPADTTHVGAPHRGPDSTAVAPPDTARLKIPIQVTAELIAVIQDSLSAKWMTEPETFVEAVTDSAAPAAKATADSLGHYELRNLKAGFYRVAAYLDQNRNQRYDAPEPQSSAVDSVLVQAGERTEKIDLKLGSRREPGPPASRGP